MKLTYKILLASLPLMAAALFLTPAAHADEYWDRKVSLFDSLPVLPQDIVFLGNSITDGGEFQELFGIENVKNRGIRSDVIGGVLKRLDQVTDGHPKKIFLLIGINDVSHNLSAAQLVKKYETLVDSIRAKSPESQLYLQSVMPINNDFRRYKGLIGKESVIKKFNEGIKEMADRKGATYIDLWPYLADKTGKLKRAYTNDGLHLTGAGYKAWTQGIEEYVRN